jgi:pyruvate kinase
MPPSQGSGPPRAVQARPRRTKIVATLGPASSAPERIEALLRAGVDIVRLNFSHGDHAEHAVLHARVRAAAEALGRPVAIMQDLQGPKIRIGPLEGGKPLTLEDGAELTITAEPDVVGRPGLVSTTYAHLPADVRAGDRILLDDGLLELRVLASEPPRVRTVVVHGGLLDEHKGINLPGVSVSAPALTDKDRQDLAVGLALGVDYVALSFVRRAEEVAEARALIRAQRADVPLIVKLEKPEAIQQLGAIIRATDGVMVARGDLAVEMSPEQVPPLQKVIIHKANAAGKPVITATQMLQSMIDNPRPTRAEASDVANAVFDGSDAVMLSGETAVGRYPVEAVGAMARITVAAEAVVVGGKPPPNGARGRTPALVRAACGLAAEVEAHAIVVYTRTGHTARLVAQCRPPMPVYAFTAAETVRRRLALYWGVQPLQVALAGDPAAMVGQLCDLLVEQGLLARGDWIVLVGAARRLTSARADFVKLHTV